MTIINYLLYLTACSDTNDNDGDGYSDCNDFSCHLEGFNSACIPWKHDEVNPKTQCQDGIDNECSIIMEGWPTCDLYIDADHISTGSEFPDPDCDNTQDNTENQFTPGRTECSNEQDDDSDGYCDMQNSSCTDGSIPGDFSCRVLWDNDETNPLSQCQDREDNDFDGIIDSDEVECENSQDNNECPDSATIFRMNKLSNAHASVWNGEYKYSICNLDYGGCPIGEENEEGSCTVIFNAEPEGAGVFVNSYQGDWDEMRNREIGTGISPGPTADYYFLLLQSNISGYSYIYRISIETVKNFVETS